MQNNIIDLTDMSFNRWKVLSLCPFRSVNGGARWYCVCLCGNFGTVDGSGLRNGHSQSCGCRNNELTSTRIKHGLWKHPLYHILTGMKGRCYNRKNEKYPRYGGRGITICQLWREDPEAFITWALANGWEKGLEIDRIDNDGPYSPDNCRFVTRKVNQRNKSNTIMVNIFDKCISIGEALDLYGKCSYKVASTRIERGWDHEKAITTPSAKKK